MLYRSMQTTRTPSRHAAATPASQYAASSALRPWTRPSSNVGRPLEEVGVPPVRDQDVFPGLLIDGEPCPAAAVRVDAQMCHRRWRLLPTTRYPSYPWRVM